MVKSIFVRFISVTDFINRRIFNTEMVGEISQCVAKGEVCDFSIGDREHGVFIL